MKMLSSLKISIFNFIETVSYHIHTKNYIENIIIHTIIIEKSREKSHPYKKLHRKHNNTYKYYRMLRVVL